MDALAASRKRFVAQLAARFFVRFHMSLIFVVTLAAALLVSRRCCWPACTGSCCATRWPSWAATSSSPPRARLDLLRCIAASRRAA
ncbi:MAG TPA: hypothetical protein VFW70_24310 [Methylomirabilota bacterium]|nr:hypothetical protein [Methylomirabilota bacterium]